MSKWPSPRNVYQERPGLLEPDPEQAEAWNEFHATTTSLTPRPERNRLFGLMVRDELYEPFALEDPFIQDLVQTPTFDRLWEVQQFGDRWAVSSLIRSKPHCRAEHSLGVFNLMRWAGIKDKATLAAALLHDAGHTAFSHHGEAVFDREGQERHEGQLATILTDDRYFIRPLLDREGIDPIEVLGAMEHPLLDAPLPDLCADRIDYLLRDGVSMNWVAPQLARGVLEELEATEDGLQWYFRSPGVAHYVTKLMELLDKGVYTNPAMAEIKYQTAELLSYALATGYLETTDLTDGTDDAVMAKLWSIDTTDQKLDGLLARQYELGMARDTPEMMGYQMDNNGVAFMDFDTKQKKRVLDPLCRVADGSIRRLSEHLADGYNPDTDRDSWIRLTTQCLPAPPRDWASEKSLAQLKFQA